MKCSRLGKFIEDALLNGLLFSPRRHRPSRANKLKSQDSAERTLSKEELVEPSKVTSKELIKRAKSIETVKTKEAVANKSSSGLVKR
jgi:hypothetical protein